MEPQVGSILEGKVTSISKFGAFVAVEGGRSGLVHISEIANTYVNDVRDYLQEGQSVRVMVLPAAVYTPSRSFTGATRLVLHPIKQ